MKKLYFILILSGFLTFCGSRANNIDRPVQGEWDFKLKKAWEISQLGQNVLDRIRGICISKEGKVFLWDSKQLKVFVCNSRGEFLYDFGGKGEGPGEILDKWAARLFLTDNDIILHEINSGRIHYFLHNGTFKETKRILKLKYSRALKTFMAPHRFLFFLSEETANKQENFLGIYDLATDNFTEIARMPEDKPLFVNDEKAGNITLHNPDIAAAAICAQFAGEKIFYGKNDEYVIKGVDLKTNETITLSITGRKGRKIRETTKKKIFESYPINKQLIKLLIEKCPDRTNFFNRILINKMGLIYVFVPDWEKKNSYEIDIFSPKGEYLYHSIIKIPDEYTNIRNLTFNYSELYLTAEDKQGESKLVKFHITPPAI